MTLKKVQQIKKRDGRLVPFDEKRIFNAISKAAKEVGFQDEKEIQKITDKVVKVLNDKYDGHTIPQVEEIQDIVVEILVDKGYKNIARTYIIYRQRRKERRQLRTPLTEVMEVAGLNENSLVVLKKRYLLKDEQGRVIEKPSDMFKRVALNIAEADEIYKNLYHQDVNIKRTAREFYEMMAKREFMPNSPTLMNAGRDLQQLSACFVLPVEDNMAGIFDAVKWTALIHQSGGGTGFSFSRLRPEGDRVKSTGGVASGPVSFMKVFDAATEQIKQGGCVDQNTLISTCQGIKPIKNLSGILEGLPAGGYHKLNIKVPTDKRIGQVEQFYNNGLTDTKTIITQDGFQFTGTLNHRIRIIDEKGDYVWKELKDLREKDWAVLQLNTFIGKKYNFSKFKKEFHFNVKQCVLPNVMKKELAEFIGYFIGDGCFHKGKIMLAIPHDSLELRDYFDRIIKEIFNLSSRYEQKSNDKSINNIYHSKMLVEWLKFIGVTKENSFKVSIPPCILEGSKEDARAFVRGLFEADGNIRKDGYISLSSISEKLVKDLQVLLLSLGIPARLRVYKNRKTSFGKNPLWRLEINTPLGLEVFKEKIGFLSKKKSWMITKKMNLNVSYNDVVPNQEKKLRKFYQSIKLRPRNKFYRKIYHYLEGVGHKSRRHLTRFRVRKLVQDYPILKKSFLFDFLKNNQFYSQVKLIKTGRALTLDLVVPTTHTYIANGFVSHNTRRGANMGILRVDHPDILKFISCKEDMKTLNNFNISVAVTDNFMKALQKDEEYELVNPRNQEVIKRISAKMVFDLIVTNTWKNGDPGIIFIDRVNAFNPTPQLGKIESTNPCGEQPLLPLESCNLGSINLAEMVCQGKGKIVVDWDKLEKVTRSAVHFLDNVIDMNRYPLPQIEEMVEKTRKIGLGVMGWADMLIKLEIAYDSKEALKLADKISKFINEKAHRASEDLAETRGVFPSFKGSVFDQPCVDYKLRNATVTTIAPTGTISIIAGCSSGIEPLFAVCYTRQNILDAGDELIEVNPLFKEMSIREGFYSGELMRQIAQQGTVRGLEEVPKKWQEVFVTSHDISPAVHVKMQAAFQAHTDNAVSKTVNFPNSATVEDVKKVYLLAYKLGCKGIAIYRYGSRDQQVLNIGGSSQKATQVPEGDSEVRSEIIKEREADKIPVKILQPSLTDLITENTLQLRPFGLELKAERSGQAKTPARLRLRANSLAGGQKTLKLKHLNTETLKHDVNHVNKSNDSVLISQEEKCPECRQKLEIKEGCMTCPICGFGKCSG